MKKLMLLACALVPFVFSCSAGISRQALREADPSITFKALRENPDRYQGKVVLLGGEIVAATVQSGETWVEVVQHPLAWGNSPQETDLSHGRFLIHFPDFRDPAIYAAGRRITIAGEVKGKKVQRLQQVDYTYPVLTPRETHLWERVGNREPRFQIGIGGWGTFR
jgi:outer membrane lipoprotein